MKTTTSERASIIFCHRLLYYAKEIAFTHAFFRLAFYYFLYSPSDMTETQQALNILRPYGM